MIRHLCDEKVDICILIMLVINFFLYNFLLLYAVYILYLSSIYIAAIHLFSIHYANHITIKGKIYVYLRKETVTVALTVSINHCKLIKRQNFIFAKGAACKINF